MVGMMFYSLTYSFYNDDNDDNDKMNLYCFLEIWLRRDLQKDHNTFEKQKVNLKAIPQPH